MLLLPSFQACRERTGLHRFPQKLIILFYDGHTHPQDSDLEALGGVRRIPSVSKQGTILHSFVMNSLANKKEVHWRIDAKHRLGPGIKKYTLSVVTKN
jgi:hypothetical protein